MSTLIWIIGGAASAMLGVLGLVCLVVSVLSHEELERKDTPTAVACGVSLTLIVLAMLMAAFTRYLTQ